MSTLRSLGPTGLHRWRALAPLAVVILAGVLGPIGVAYAAPGQDRAYHGYPDVETNGFGATESWGGSLRLYAGHDQTGEAMVSYCIDRGLRYPRGTDPDLDDANSGFAVIGDLPAERGVGLADRQALAYALWRHGATTDDRTAGAMFLLTHVLAGDTDFGPPRLEDQVLGPDWPDGPGVLALAIALRDEAMANRGPWALTATLVHGQGDRFRVEGSLRGPGGGIPGRTVAVTVGNGSGGGVVTTAADGTFTAPVVAGNPAAPVTIEARVAATPSYYRVIRGRADTQRMITSNGDGPPIVATASATVPTATVRVTKTTTNPGHQTGAGARFALRAGAPDGPVVAERTVGADGQAPPIDGLVPGRYVLVEVAAPPGQVLDPTPEVLDLAPGDSRTVTRTNAVTRDGTLVLHKRDRDTGDLLAGAVFAVHFDDGLGGPPVPIGPGPDATLGTDDDGRWVTDTAPVTIDGLVAGRYTVVEEAPPPGYTLPEVDDRRRVVELTYGDPATEDDDVVHVALDIDNHRPVLATQVIADGAPVDLVAPGREVRDVVALDGVASTTTATITTTVFGPYGDDDVVDCAADAAVATLTHDVVGSGASITEGVSLVAPGRYTFVASVVTADGGTATHACGLPTETVAVPGVTTQVERDDFTVGEGVADVVTLHGIPDEVPGVVRVTAHGPFRADDEPVCDATTEAFHDEFDVVGGGEHRSAAFAPTLAGRYHFVARWTLATDDAPVSVTHPCGIDGEMVSVRPAVATVASIPTTVVGQPVFDTVALVGLAGPGVSDATAGAGSGGVDGTGGADGPVSPLALGGQVTVDWFGPYPALDAATCEAADRVAGATVATDGTVDLAAPPWYPSGAGTYVAVARWRATDGTTATHLCGLAAESVEVTDPVVPTPRVATVRGSSASPRALLADTGATTVALVVAGALLAGLGFSALRGQRRALQIVRVRDEWSAVRGRWFGDR